jgi:hypothetical protein
VFCCGLYSAETDPAPFEIKPSKRAERIARPLDRGALFGGRVAPKPNLRVVLACDLSCASGPDGAEAADCEPPRSVTAGLILEDPRSNAAGTNSDPEPGNCIVPKKGVGFAWRQL